MVKERLTVNVVVLKDSSSTSEKVDTSLQAWKDLIVLECGIALAGDPNPSVSVGKDLVLQELSTTPVMHVNSACGSMVNGAPENDGVGFVLNLNAGNSVAVNVILFQ